MSMKVLYLDQDTHHLFLSRFTSNQVVILLALITYLQTLPTVTHYFPIFCQISTTFKSCEPDKPVKRYDYNETNLYEYENLLTKFLTENYYLNEIIPNEDGFDNLVTKIHDLIDQCFLVDEAMLKSKRNRLNKPWITNGIITLSVKTTTYINYGESLLRNLKPMKEILFYIKIIKNTVNN